MAEKNADNPLSEIFTDSTSQVDPKSIVAILKPFLRINRKDGSIFFTPNSTRLTAKKKILLFVLARKASYMQGIVESEWVTPKEVKSELENIPSGTIDSAIKLLSEKGPLRGKDGKYCVPDLAFAQVEQAFNSDIRQLNNSSDGK